MDKARIEEQAGEPLGRQEVEWAQRSVGALAAAAGRVIRGKDDAIRLALTGLLCRGHVLIEDIPGVGKTTLAKALARAAGGTFRRIQFTSDLMPSDIIGVTVYKQNGDGFVFTPGPIFANIVLADEINRTNPRTQSALLEAMNERQVTVEGKTYPCGEPFMVLATQNPHDFYGTYPLPESQMDRFLVRVQLGYPDQETERAIVTAGGMDAALGQVSPAVAVEEVVRLAGLVERVRVAPALVDYLLELAAESRKERSLALGISPRGAIHLHRAAQATALMEGRAFVIPDDIQAVLSPVLSHRVIPAGSYTSAPAERRRASEQIVKELVERIPVPV